MESNVQSITEEFKKYIEEQLVSIYPPPESQEIRSASRRPTKPVPENAQKIMLHAQTVKGTNEGQVNAKDGRVPVNKPARWPHSVHGVVAFKFNEIVCWGTGTMIGPNVVLTAGHNLYSHQYKVYADDVQFLPGMNGRLLPLGLAKAEKYFVSPRYIREEKEDYGIILLNEPICEKTGYFGLACLTPEEIRSKKINVTGYPGDKVASKPDNTYEMYGMEGEAANIDEIQGYIHYLIDTGTGQSGGGVWYQDGENYYVCGVHVSGTHFVNTATLLTRAMYQQIHAWLQLQSTSFNELFLKLRDGALEYCFSWNKITVECVSILMKYHLDEITDLFFSHQEIGIEKAQMLAQKTSWTNLSKLDLYYNNIDSEGVRALAQNTSWTNLSMLTLYCNNIDSEGARALAQNTSWTNLSMLDLSNNKIGSEGARALAQNTSWTNLSTLALYCNNIDSEGAKPLAQNTSWTNLSKLDLSYNNIDSEGASALAQNTSWTNLSELYLSYNNVDSEGARALAQNTSWTNLSELYLSYSNIDSEGARALAQNTSWTNLSTLYLRKNKIVSEGARALAQNTSWTNLSKLDLSDNNIDSEGVSALAQNTSWTNLSKLNLLRNRINSEEARALTILVSKKFEIIL